MPAEDATHAQRKALELNLDPSIFGSFAEIGAGQEVARWFFRVGAASGTVAKTICAYDKAVSDDLYGAGGRYVSRPRLEKMLATEWESLQHQVGAERRRGMKLFAFADTAAARNYAGTNVQHAWLGVRFQAEAAGDPSDVVVHANLRDPTAQLQAEALGLLGVNLVHAVHHARVDEHAFIRGLFDGLDLGRIELDVVMPRGPAFDGWDVYLSHASLVSGGVATAVVFDGADPFPSPAEMLYKRPLVLAPGHFQDVGDVHARVIETATAALDEELDPAARPALGLFALTDVEHDAPEAPEERGRQVLDRVGELLKRGAGVMVLRERELFRAAAFVERYTGQPIRFAVSAGVLVRVLQDAQYRELRGQLLEAISRLFQRNVKLYVFPSRVSALPDELRPMAGPDTGDLVGALELRPEGPLAHLYDYLLDAGFIVPMAPVATAAEPA